MKRTIWADEAIASVVNDRFIPLMLYADDAGTAEVFHRYSVVATPTTIIADSHGTVLARVQGKMDKAEFLEFLEY